MSNSKDKARLTELAAQWQAQSKPGMLDRFTLADLRLLLEQFVPLQQLIHEIAASEAHLDESSSVVPITKALSVDSDEVITLREKVVELESELKRLQQQTVQDEQKLEQAAESLQAQNQQLKQYTDSEAQLKKQLEQLKASYDQSQAALNNSEQQLKQAQNAAAGYQQQVASLEQQLAQFQPSAELQFLRSDAVLTSSLGLDLSVNDQQALIAMVSILAQKDNLERLWDTLRERCDAEKRTASAQEQALLAAALGWYNHNWKSRPFQLLQPAVDTGFDFEQQQKTKHQTDGETIKQVWLPGLADGAGKPLRKSLVLTH